MAIFYHLLAAGESFNQILTRKYIIFTLLKEIGAF
jgi:hypothetical protein